jgi:uncharacterized RDD family membrane protein YckC/DNA-directed RNA polymerase subunit M/transcription elongation factor TFIIS
MPVKVKCPKCAKVLNAPEAARGKAVKCPGCESKVPVPAEAVAASGSLTAAKPAAKSSAGKPAARPAPKSTTADDDDFLSGLDLGSVEDTATRVCPKCGQPLMEEETECRKCGTDTMTGGMGRKAKRREKIRQMGGADPNEFYTHVWKDSWAFIKEHKDLVLRTGLYWTVLNLGLAASTFFGAVVCVNLPPKSFWIGIAVVCAMAVPGWYWSLSNIIVQSILRKEPLDRVNFDFFTAVSLGFKSYIWAYILTLTLPIPLLPLAVFPIALIHMAMPYTYKAWIGWEMAKIFVKNIGQVLYWWVVFLAVQFPVLAILGGLTYLAVSQNLVNRFAGWIYSSSKWFGGIAGVDAPQTLELWMSGEQSIMFMGVSGLFAALFVSLTIAPFCFLLAVPSVFMMRATASLATHCKPRLELVTEQKRGIPCGFWVRFLAHLVDSLLVNVIVAAGGLVYFLLTLIAKPEGFMGVLQMIVAVGAILFAVWVYYAKGESGGWMATLGKKSLGIVVTDMNGNRITLQAATIRFLVKNTISGILGIGFMMAGFTPKKQALHDTLAKTLVVWHGDE